MYSRIICVSLDIPDVYYYRMAAVGQTVKFPCSSKLQYGDVVWSRLVTPASGQTYIYMGGHVDLGHDPRFMVLDRNHLHTLVITHVMLNDSGYYLCVEDSGGGRKRFYYLTVEG